MKFIVLLLAVIESAVMIVASWFAVRLLCVYSVAVTVALLVFALTPIGDALRLVLYLPYMPALKLIKNNGMWTVAMFIVFAVGCVVSCVFPWWGGVDRLEFWPDWVGRMALCLLIVELFFSLFTASLAAQEEH